MDSDDEEMPYLELLNENSGNYLIQNNYELQDCLSVEPIFTEIGTETWSSECFPILLNGSSTSENGHIKGITDYIRTEKVQGKYDFKNLNNHIKISHVSNVEQTMDSIKNESITTSSPATTQNSESSQESILRNYFKMINSTGKSEQGKQKRTLLLLPHGDSYEITTTNELLDQIQSQDCSEDSNISGDVTGCTTEIEQLIPVMTPADYVKQKEDYGEISSTFVYEKELDFDDSSNLNEFYSTVTAVKCKVCSCLYEKTSEMRNHLKRIHGDLLKCKQAADKKDNQERPRVIMKSLLNTNAEKEITLFLCSICNNMFSTRQLLMEHMEIHNQESNISEESDENRTADIQNENPVHSMRNLARSLLKKQQKAMRRVKCSIKGCTLRFSNNESKLRHEECHIPNMKEFQCPECKEIFSLWRICTKHLWTCHRMDAGLYSCSICNKYKSNSAVLVMRHMDIHNSEKPFVCPECGKGFKQQTQLRNHRVIHQRVRLSPWSTTRWCTICERSFANEKSLKQHIQGVHQKLKPYICNVCGHKTTRKSMLEVHSRQHTGDKPHDCPHCTFKTADSNCLRKHVMKHYGFMQYSCPYCKYQSIQSSAYKNHLITRHPGSKEIFKCMYCNFTSVKFESYLTHVKCHEHDEGKVELKI